MQLSIEDVIEPRLKAAGFHTPVSIFQAAYNGGGVQASAGTHDGGGALDHAKGNDAETIIWRECGVADWQRGSPEDSAFDDHNHGIWQGCPHVSSGADGQLDQYRAGCSGLSGWGPDQSPYVKPISWQDAYKKYANSGPEGLFDMTEQIWFHRSDEYGINNDGIWHDVPIGDGADAPFSVVNGDTKQITATANAIFSGCADDADVSICWREMRAKDGADNDYTSTRGPRNAEGATSSKAAEATYNGKLNKDGDGWKSRLRLSVRTKTAGVKMTDLLIEGWHS
jgi:hypothetical protein